MNPPEELFEDKEWEGTPLGDGFLGREFDRNTCKNLMKRTILSLAKGNSHYAFVAGSIGLDRDPKISDQRIPPCLPAGRYNIFSGIPVEFRKVRVFN